MGQIASGRLVKSVPATPQFGELQPPHVPRELIRRAFGSSPSHYPYAWWTEKEGFCGASPETLFHQQGRRLTTMALAGTARRRMKAYSSTTTRKSGSMKSWPGASSPACPPAAASAARPAGC